jgi:Cu/Zn superoxide dismutase
MRQGMMLLLCAALAACGSSSNPGNQYKATLTFAQELPVPPVTSTGSGTASLTDNGTSMSYTITVSGLTSAVTLSHIHVGGPTQASGKVIVNLNAPTSGTSTGSFTAPNQGAVDNNGSPVTTYAQVLNFIKTGNAYVNVHTSNNPGGEVRGQIVLAQ